jgi:hypothetical protein
VEILKEGEYLEDQSVVCILLLEWILKTSVEKTLNELIWLRLQKSGGMARSLCSTFGFHKMREISSLTKEFLGL